MLWKIKFAWIDFWRVHNKPTRGKNDATYKNKKNRTNNWSISPPAAPMLFRNNFLGVLFWQDVPHFIFELGMSQDLCKQPHLPWDQSQI